MHIDKETSRFFFVVASKTKFIVSSSGAKMLKQTTFSDGKKDAKQYVKKSQLCPLAKV